MGAGPWQTLLPPLTYLPRGRRVCGPETLKTSLHRLWPGGLVITLQGRLLSECHFLGLKIMVLE